MGKLNKLPVSRMLSNPLPKTLPLFANLFRCPSLVELSVAGMNIFRNTYEFERMVFLATWSIKMHNRFYLGDDYECTHSLVRKFTKNIRL